VLFSAPGLEDLWELHVSALSGQQDLAQRDRTFTGTNARNGFAQTCAAPSRRR
jgi:hypothetical protein